MKYAASLVVVASSALLVAMVALGQTGVNRHVTSVGSYNVNFTPKLADGSFPIPPFPKGSSFEPIRPILSADGSFPIPPFPKGSSFEPIRPILSADGSFPIPPFPKGSSFLSQAA